MTTRKPERETKPDAGEQEPGDSLLRIYRQQVGHTGLLTPAEEQELGKAIAAGGDKGEQARRALVSANLRLVEALAHQYQDRGVELSDLIQEGNLGLIEAANKWDYRRSLRFATYARWWIQRYIRRAVSKASRRTISLDGPGGRDQTPLADMIPVQNDLSPEDLAELLGLGDEIKNITGRLPEQERRVIELRYGLADGQSRSQEECAAELGITRGKMRRLEQKAFRRLAWRGGDAWK